MKKAGAEMPSLFHLNRVSYGSNVNLLKIVGGNKLVSGRPLTIGIVKLRMRGSATIGIRISV